MVSALEPISHMAGFDAPHNPMRRPPSAHYAREYAALVRRYEGVPVDISFRQLVGPLPASEYTHGLYPYPARLLRHIPRFLLSTEAVTSDIDVVFDPFVGSGTVLLEAQLRGLASIGVEQNPVAALVSRVKVSRGSHAHSATVLNEALAVAKRRRRVPDLSPLLSRWYSNEAMSALGRLAAVAEDSEERDRDLVQLCLALTARRMATTDPRIPVPVKGTRNETASCSDVWRQWALEGASIVAKLETLPPGRPIAEVRAGDARDVTMWPSSEQAVKTLLLTSPPYGAAQKYVRSTSLEAAWLGHAPTGKTVHLEHSSIGREHLSPQDLMLKLSSVTSSQLQLALASIAKKDARRGAIYLAYFTDMQRTFLNAHSVGVKRIALVSGDNHVAGGVLRTSQHLADIIQSLGYKRTLSVRDPIRGRTLLTSRKNGAPAPAEYIEIFEMANL
ncbi:DNA methyltransferase [uncultured Plantibacter sp.]|uniref:DNA methyltransferase n=1 Tax=uncultured Plantibacter sp. TaxID=293337 RepID=UPI0028D35014|nr:DNA methyltransferase [uncultured Plantibacter sp.]